ncbi:MAG TPA: beta-ketoacyl synthase N-terminal-like domain-containing protein [Polyangiaceae bacterium]|nr:beta-ketoacyl synthase N-terminal-like domain-containing protein [Polyangiaceae bacterium]
MSRRHGVSDRTDEATGQQGFGSQTKLRVAPRNVQLLHEVVITGVGALLPNCDNRETFWQQLRDGQSQMAIEPDPADGIPCAMGRVRDFECARYMDGIPARLYQGCHREQQLYLASVVQAARDAGLTLDDLPGVRTALFDGTSRGNFAHWYELIHHKVHDASRFSPRDLNLGMPGQAVGLAAAILGVQGPTFTFNNSCASGVVAIGHAFRELQSGRIDVAFGTGHDAALIAPLYQMYRDAGLVSSERESPELAIRPYAGSSANAFGEGAVTLVLERREHAEARGAVPLAQVVAFRHGNGGEHPTDVDFSGGRPAQLLEQNLEEAGLTSAEVDFVLGHGNGVQASDISELNYMKRVFGRRTRDVPLISTKPIYGHTLGASSALNVAAAALMLHHDYVVPTVRLDERRVVHGFNHQANRGEARPLRSGFIVAYGIGGQNATLLMRKDGA